MSVAVAATVGVDTVITGGVFADHTLIGSTDTVRPIEKPVINSEKEITASRHSRGIDAPPTYPRGETCHVYG